MHVIIEKWKRMSKDFVTGMLSQLGQIHNLAHTVVWAKSTNNLYHLVIQMMYFMHFPSGSEHVTTGFI